MLKLYEISDLYRSFLSAIDSGEIEDEQVINDTLDSIQQEFDTKLDNIACIIKTLTAEADAIDAEVKRLQDRSRAKRNAVERMKNYITAQMLSIGQTRFENERNRITFRDSQSLYISDPDALMTSLQVAERGDLFQVEQTVKFDKSSIKKAMKDGAFFAGCDVVKTKNIQIK